MLTSLNIATDGLLDGGSKPTLSLVTEGLIRFPVEAIVIDEGGGGSIAKRRSSEYRGPLDKKFEGKWRKRLDQEDEELLAFIVSVTPYL